MKNNRINILQINASSKFYGGVSAMIFNIYKNINQDKFHFDFFCCEYSTYDNVKIEIQKLGGKIIEGHIFGSPIKKKIMLAYKLFQINKKNKYDIVHINSGSFFFNLEVALIFKLCRVRKIIIHSHSSGGNTGIKLVLMNYLKPLLCYCSTDVLACSSTAAYYMFPKQVVDNGICKIIKNGINTSLFTFNKLTRNDIRNTLGINEKTLLIGHVGRFTAVKNHKFMLELANNLIKEKVNMKIIFLGTGELYDEIVELSKEMKIFNYIIFQGHTDNVNEFMHAIDILLLPSLFEGLPLVAVEAQANGLPCLLSNNISIEASFTDLVHYLPLDSVVSWTDQIKNMRPILDRQIFNQQVVKKGYDISNTVRCLENVYLKSGENYE